MADDITWEEWVDGHNGRPCDDLTVHEHFDCFECYLADRVGVIPRPHECAHGGIARDSTLRDGTQTVSMTTDDSQARLDAGTFEDPERERHDLEGQ